MASVRGQNGPLTVVAYRGDAKTLLAFDLSTPESRVRLAGFTPCRWMMFNPHC